MSYRVRAALGCWAAALGLGPAGCFNDPSEVQTETDAVSTGDSEDSTTSTSTGTAQEATTTDSESDPETGRTTSTGLDTSTGTDTSGSSSGTGEPACDDMRLDPGDLCFAPHVLVGDATPTAVLIVADFDSDDMLDIAAGHDDGVSIHRGSGDGGFEEIWRTSMLDGVLGLAVARPSDDPLPHLVATTPDAAEVLTFVDPLGLDTQSSLLVGGEPYDAEFGGFGSQGNTLLAVVSNVATGNVELLPLALGMLSQGPQLQSGTAPQRIATGGLDGTASDDVVVANFGANTISVFLNPAGDAPPSLTLPAHAGPRDVAITDFDGDALSDIVAIHDDGFVGLWRGNGGGTFASGEFEFIGGGPRALAVADLDNDGLNDIAVALELANAVGILRGGDSLPPAELFATLSTPAAIVAGDFNDDGALDLATGSGSIGQGIAVILASP